MSELPRAESKTASPARKGRFFYTASILAVLGISYGSLMLWPSTSSDEQPRPRTLPLPPKAEIQNTAATVGDSQPGDSKAKTDADYARMIVGEWEQKNKGERSLTIREDGTAMMVVKLDSYYAFIFGSKIEADIDWTIEKGEITFAMTGGRPATAVDLVKSSIGEKITQRIIEATEDRFVLADIKDGKPDPPWTRVGAASDEASATK